MSFLENPFADVEEPAIVEGNPFGNYDADQQQHEYETLSKQAASLAERMCTEEVAKLAQLADQEQHAESLRRELAELADERSTRLPARRTHPITIPADCESAGSSFTLSPLPERTTLAILADLQKQLEDRQAMGATLTDAVDVFRGQLLMQSAADESRRCDTLVSLDALPLETERVAQQRLRHDTTSLEAHLRQVMALQSTAATTDGDTSLVAALLAHARGALQQHEALVATVAASCVQAQRQERAGHAAAANTACLRSYLDAAEDSRDGGRERKSRRVEGVPPSSAELADTAAANASLQHDIARLEAALSASLRSGASSHMALPAVGDSYAAAALLAAAVERRDALARDVDELGHEVLLLRDVVLRESKANGGSGSLSARAAALMSSNAAAAQAPQGAVSRSSAKGFEQSVTARFAVVDELLGNEEECVATGDIEGDVSARGVALRARLAFNESFALLQDACVAALTSIQEQLRRQAFQATLFTRLVARDADFSPPIIRRVLEAAKPPLRPPLHATPGGAVSTDLHDVARWYLTGTRTDRSFESDAAAAVSTAQDQLTQRLCAEVERYGPLWERRQAAWRRTCAALAGFASLPLEPVENMNAISFAGPTPGAAYCVHTTVQMGDAVSSEGSEAAVVAEATAQSLTAALERRKAGLDKKLAWFGQQEHAKPLKSLRALHNECSTLASRLEAFEAVVCSAENARDQLLGLEEKVVRARAEVAALEGEAAKLQAETETLRESIASLS